MARIVNRALLLANRLLEAEDPKSTFQKLPRDHFTITVTHYNWSCGDGCCSDSGYRLHVLNDRTKDVVLDDYEWEFNRDRMSRINQALDAIEPLIGRPPQYEDYTVVDEELYSDQENLDEALALAFQLLEKEEDGWIGVDLDGTLAKYTTWKGLTHIGEPIPKMVARVRRWVGRGKKVKIFTARADDEKSVNAIKKWLKKHDLPDLEVTNLKDKDMVELWDDKAVAVEKNTGEAK